MRGTKAFCIALQLAPFWLWGVLLPGVSAQGLVSVPPTMTHELNAYYISKLGVDFSYYSILTGRNVLGTNAYNLVNGIRDNADPLTAASKTSTMRGFYESNGIGGKVMVDVFYKFVRCAAPPNCNDFERVLITSSRDPSGPQELLTVSKGVIPRIGWLINANQSAVNAVLGQPSTIERKYKDLVYNAQLFYKVTPPPPPCSSANPQTQLGAIGEFENLPQFGCIDYLGYTMLLATDTETGANAMRDFGTSAEQCDGSLVVFYTTDFASRTGPRIIALLKKPNAVPITLRMTLPYNTACIPNIDYSDPEIVLRAAAFLSLEDPFSPGPAHPTTFKDIPTTIEDLGFVDACAPNVYSAFYGAFLTGNSNDIAEAFPGNQTFINRLVKHDGAEVCVSAIGNNEEDARDSDEDACAQLYFGNADQQREGFVTYNVLNSTAPAPDPLQSFGFAQDCKERYQLKVENILPQVAIDFEADKAFLLSSTEVKIHMDAVAANAASIVALEIALASSGIVVARTIARSGLYRRQRLSSSMARIIACLTTAFVITIFNVPNFALITKSLQNHNGKRIFTTATARMYKPSNFSSVLMAETHSFVTVQGSSATAVIGLILYLVALFFSLYVTWGEFTEIIKRKNEAARCLGHEALVADKHLLIEWRGTDSKLHDILHPGAVKETGMAADIELMRRAVARKQMEAGDPQGGYSPRGQYQGGGLGSPREQYRGPVMV